MLIEPTSASARPATHRWRWPAAVVALVMIGLGLWSIVSQHYFGRTSKFGGAAISLDGEPAVLMGLLYVSLGMMPFALWFRTPQAAAWWASLCSVAFLGLLAALLYA